MPGNCISLSSECKNLTISFVKGWGRSYRRQEVTDCPAWLEILLWVIVMSNWDSFYFCTNHTRYFVIIFDIQVWVIFMTHYFDSICCIFCDFILIIGWQLYDRCFLILLQLLSQNSYPPCSETSSQTYASIMIFNKNEDFCENLFLRKFQMPYWNVAIMISK